MPQLMLIFTLVVFVSVAGADDDCDTEIFDGRECCKLFHLLYPYRKAESTEECFEKYRDGSTESYIKLNERACILECIFYEEGLLTEDNLMNKTAITEYFTPPFLVLQPVMEDIIEKSFSSYQSDEEASSSSLECKSGVYQFNRYLSREAFLNCPSALWSASSHCEELKPQIAECPKAIIV